MCRFLAIMVYYIRTGNAYHMFTKLNILQPESNISLGHIPLRQLLPLCVVLTLNFLRARCKTHNEILLYIIIIYIVT